MTYEEFLESVDIFEEGTPLSVDIHTWERDGDTLIGELKEISTFTGGQFEQSCKRYLFKTSHGLVSTILGSSVDKQLESQNLIGRILAITFKGQIQLESGRACNRFTVVDVTESFKKLQHQEMINKAARTVNLPEAVIEPDIIDQEEENAENDNETLGKKKTIFGKK